LITGACHLVVINESSVPAVCRQAAFSQASIC
jgi:hypothetical protein